jgi:NADH:ubiquinone reductase (H+-translocating)
MPTTPKLSERPRILVVGGGYLGFYVAKNLQKKVKVHGGVVTLVDPLPYMTYQPFLPEVMSGSIEPRHITVPHARHLRDTELLQGKVTKIDHATKTATVEGVDGVEFAVPYQDVVVAAGAITKTFPIPGLAQAGIGVKRVEEAIFLRDHVQERIQFADNTADEEARKRALRFIVVGGGFNGVETISELQDAARLAAERSNNITPADLDFQLVEAMPKIMPEIKAETAEWVVEHLRSRGINVRLQTSLGDATDKHLKLTSMANDETKGQVIDEFDVDTLIWTAGVQANPMVRNTDFTVEPRGRLVVDASLRALDADGKVIEGAWSAGDVAAVPDLSGKGLPDNTCVPNAQHAVRQAKRLAKNVYAARYGVGKVTDYKHEPLGAVAGLGYGKGVAKIIKFPLKGFLAWAAHRGYHGFAMPTWERKFRVFGGWFNQLISGRDVWGVRNVQQPHADFVEAATPKPKPAESK